MLRLVRDVGLQQENQKLCHSETILQDGRLPESGLPVLSDDPVIRHRLTLFCWAANL